MTLPPILHKEVLHVPVYAWGAGVGALIIALLVFKRRGGSGVQTALPMNTASMVPSTLSAQPSAPPSLPYPGQQTTPPPAPPRLPWFATSRQPQAVPTLPPMPSGGMLPPPVNGPFQPWASSQTGYAFLPSSSPIPTSPPWWLQSRLPSALPSAPTQQQPTSVAQGALASQYAPSTN